MEGTVIVADDDRTIRTVLSQALTRAGCRVRSTGTISTLWRWIEEGEGDCVVSDVMMPDGDALDLLPAIQRKRPDLPVIVMSAQNTMMTAIRATEVGAYEYIPKPFDLREVLSQVNKALTRQKSGAARGLDDMPEDRHQALPLIGRSAATVSLNAPSGFVSTRMSAKAGSTSASGVSSPKCPSSTHIIVAMPVTGFDIE